MPGDFQIARHIKCWRAVVCLCSSRWVGVQQHGSALSVAMNELNISAVMWSSQDRMSLHLCSLRPDWRTGSVGTNSTEDVVGDCFWRFAWVWCPVNLSWNQNLLLKWVDFLRECVKVTPFFIQQIIVNTNGTDQEEFVAACVEKLPPVTPEITPLIQRQTEISLQGVPVVKLKPTNHLPGDRMCHRSTLQPVEARSPLPATLAIRNSRQ